MAEPTKPSHLSSVGMSGQDRRCQPSDAPRATPGETEKVICERCGQAEMFRMHAVWRCPNCGFKTDCCGW